MALRDLKGILCCIAKMAFWFVVVVARQQQVDSLACGSKTEKQKVVKTSSVVEGSKTVDVVG